MFSKPAIVSEARNCSGAALLLLLLIASGSAHAGAPYCALRDPGHQIYELYPGATGYRSVVGDINTETQLAVDAQIPFQLHKGELGQHTLYIPVDDDQPLGYIQIHSELTEWGLAEIVWALTRELEVKGFRFQRCRGRACQTAMDKGLMALVHGKDQSSLLGLVDQRGLLLAEHSTSMSESERMLAGAVVRSAIKVIAVIESGWKTTVSELRDQPPEP